MLWISCLHVLRVAGSLVLVIGCDVQNGTGGEWQIGVILCVTSSDLGTLGVQSNGYLTTGLGLLGGPGIVNDGLVVFVLAVREVHADNVKAGGSQLVDSLDRVRLGSNCADDGCSSEVLLGGVCCVETSQPLDAAIARHVVCSCDSYGCGSVARHLRNVFGSWMSGLNIRSAAG